MIENNDRCYNRHPLPLYITSIVGEAIAIGKCISDYMFKKAVDDDIVLFGFLFATGIGAAVYLSRENKKRRIPELDIRSDESKLEEQVRRI